MRPLAIIDPCSSITLRRDMEAAGFRAECFGDAPSALTALRRRSYALAILDLDLDVDLHGGDPFQVCREVSRIVPVIAITAEGCEDICVQAFESGADDCVVRTLTGRELVARVRNVLRRSANENEAATCDLDTLSISLPEMRVRNGEVVHELSRGEAEVLTLLLERSPAPITTVEMARVLPAKRATIESRIKSLRKKLGPDRLVTRGRFGYELR
jgi:DNA-binding response OmpR family regulator